ncbi:glycoside hydrolase family 18 protein [Aspergillus lucknowensis]|uniref:chitinase n=1 Tax=Aspergillus lucknowensis TaxID=176173 RepID=A0ABR4LS76_9EURO
MTSLICPLLLALLIADGAFGERCIMYLTGQHNVVPDVSLVADVTHVALAFMHSSTFNSHNVSEWPLFTTVEDGFSEAAATEETRGLFARNVKRMLDETGADGVDIDWEYPGGNGEDYKQIPNSEKAWEIESYPKLLTEIRTALGAEKLISAAVPGLPRDMLAFTQGTIPSIAASLDFFNIMTYDLMNRRDTVTKHHTGIRLSLEAIDAYVANGVPPEKANLGFAFYVKWFRTDPDGYCSKDHVLGCRTVLMEDPNTGADLGQAGAFSWHDRVPAELGASFDRALKQGEYDTGGGGYYFWDGEENIFWSFDTPEAIRRKFPEIVAPRGLGGVFAWGLGEDAPDFGHLKALTSGFRGVIRQDGLGNGEVSGETESDVHERWREEGL